MLTESESVACSFLEEEASFLLVAAGFFGEVAFPLGATAAFFELELVVAAVTTSSLAPTAMA